ncbi:uncharacterized protein [Coffea arabica]|uniref:Reverse transcriptase/retrotransposon-derived protein RNase H-like domain-containing protein n=1 Tax=Coffea arabica TaxID=13443 RepID=A0ABM4WMS6_COFAR
MNPDDTKLAERECQELLTFGLIEISHSQWACRAFYVNKRSEKISKAKWFSKFYMNPDDTKLAERECQELLTFGLIEISHSQWACRAFYVNKRSEKEFILRIGTKLVFVFLIIVFNGSNTFEEHLTLLKDFHNLVKQYGIMLSEKKMFLAQQEISFLGMKIAKGKCMPEQHVGQSVMDFPEENLSKTQVQQFLGIVNYVREFIPQASKHISPLTKMLKKKPPLWGSSQTQAIRILKEELQNLPTLHIPSNGKRILQTDASGKFRGAVLLEPVALSFQHPFEFVYSYNILEELLQYQKVLKIVAMVLENTERVMVYCYHQNKKVLANFYEMFLRKLNLPLEEVWLVLNHI